MGTTSTKRDHCMTPTGTMSFECRGDDGDEDDDRDDDGGKVVDSDSCSNCSLALSLQFASRLWTIIAII